MARRGQTSGVYDAAAMRRLHPDPPPLLLELEQMARADEVPAIARETGRFLSTIVHAMQANRILEIGTSYGYSTLWMALALPPAGKIWTVDPDDARTAVAREFFARSERADAIEIVMQPALEILPTFPVHNLDVVFLDAVDAENGAYLDAVVPLLKRSGLVIVDAIGRSAEGFARAFLSHPALDATVLPLGEGLGIGARIE